MTDMPYNHINIKQSLYYLLGIRQMQQADFFLCPTCQLAISMKRKDAHLRKCQGGNIQEPLDVPLKKPPTSNKITCKICHKTMPLDQFVYHQYICTEPMIPCEFCKRQILCFRLEDHQNNCSIYLEDQRKRYLQLVEILKKHFLLIYGVHLEGQLSIDTVTLLVHQVLPALKNMDKGMSSKEIEAIQTTKLQQQQLPMCSICLDGIYKAQTIKDFQCKHLFHEKCIVDWLRGHSTCPNCRKDLKPAK